MAKTSKPEQDVFYNGRDLVRFHSCRPSAETRGGSDKRLTSTGQLKALTLVR
ncbi:Hypothetical protein SMAX5B_000815 [Scophthalmus maximus]|uniref:Uncharacterized protein n=1 Tax=Scophthalmus maximus TaxID=52904 RepID=A0A2U9BKP8_SCOMX|nr:Hypothetical protein SMAX5B_000815 [Scophthalmus maximus]